MGSADTWTTVNFGEANPGVQTPLCLTFWLEASEASMVQMGIALGAYSARDAPTGRWMASFYGRMAGNVNTFRELADRIPGTSGDAFEEQLFGVVRSGERSRPVGRRYPFVALKAPYAAWRASRELLRLREGNDAWWRVAAEHPCDDLTTAIATFGEAYSRFARLMYVHGLVTMLAQACFARVAALASEAGMPGAEAELVTGHGGLEETRLLADLWAVARDGAVLDDFVARYGYHGPTSGDISSASWREDSSSIGQLLAGYAGLPADESPARRQDRQVARRRVLERSLLAALPRHRRTLASTVLRATARFVPQREIGKASYLQALDVARAAARAAGRELVRERRLDAPDEVFFLTAQELMRGHVPPLIAERRQRYEEYRRLVLPDTWRGMPEPVADRPADGVVTGLGVVPGVVTGRVRVVTDPLADDPLEHGEILVCATTNPSWVTLFLVAGALVIDIGGALSHGAIAARELGIPCVINTGDGTRRLRNGDEVRVDGSTGEVALLKASIEREEMAL